MKYDKLLILAGFVLIAAGSSYFGLGDYLTLEFLKSSQARIIESYSTAPLKFSLLFVLTYILVTALSLPGAAIMTLAAGGIFGLMWGVILVSFASTIGATLSMLVSRYLFRGAVEKKFAIQLKTINQGVQKEGAFYLFTLRLVPVVPFFIINLVMGLTVMSIPAFYLVSQVGMLAGTIVYINAGTQLAEIESVSGILSPSIIASFALLGIFPWMARKLVNWIRQRSSFSSTSARFTRPKSFDRDLVVIGAGSGGLVSAYIAASLKAKVSLIEKNKMGGDCLNTGCVPSKAFIRSAKFASDINRAKEFGFEKMNVGFEFDQIMKRVERIIQQVEPHDSIERYESLGVDVIQGTAKITTPYTVEVNGRVLTTRNIIIATGANPSIPEIPGLNKVDFYTSDTIWGLDEDPGRLVVLGGGPIGTELAQSFGRLGYPVTQVEKAEQILGREDIEVSRLVRDQMLAEGIEVKTGHRALEILNENGRKTLITTSSSGKTNIPFDNLLLALGRTANTNDFGLDELGVLKNTNGTIKVNANLQTNYSNIYAVGDVAGPYQFTHVAAHQAWYAVVNALFGDIKKFRVDYSVIPWATFSSPEVARVGINEKEANQKNIQYEVTVFNVEELDRAIADEEAKGLIKVITRKGSDKILGVTIVSQHAGDLISEYVLAMKHGLGLGKVMSTIHIYPTMAEMNKYVAGEWRKNHKPEWLLDLVEKYHCWRRNGEKGFDGREFAITDP